MYTTGRCVCSYVCHPINKWNTIVDATKISQLSQRRVGMTILFNLNINNLLQREVNWRARYVDIWKQCRICTVYTLNGTKRTENDDNILFPSNEHRRKIIHQTHIYLVFTSCFRLRPIQQQRQWQWQRHCTTSNYMWVSDKRQKGKTCSERNGTKRKRDRDGENQTFATMGRMKEKRFIQ